jgi:DNA-binding Xre family transcriptional regulator
MVKKIYEWDQVKAKRLSYAMRTSSLRKVAKEAGVSHETINNLKKGKLQTVKLPILKKICDYLGYDLKTILK